MVEDDGEFKKLVFFPNGSKRVEKYPIDEVLYHIRQCKEAGLLTGVTYSSSGGYYISDLSPSGHEFLADIRNDSVWSKTKDGAKAIGAESLRAISEIAKSVISNLISSKLGL